MLDQLTENVAKGIFGWVTVGDLPGDLRQLAAYADLTFSAQLVVNAPYTADHDRVIDLCREAFADNPGMGKRTDHQLLQRLRCLSPRATRQHEATYQQRQSTNQ